MSVRRFSNLSAYVLPAKGLLRGKTIVRCAEDSRVGCGVAAAKSLGVNMVDLQERASVTSDTRLADEGTLLAIALEDLPSRRTRNRSRQRRGIFWRPAGSSQE